MIEIIRDKIALSRIGAEWNALASLFGSPLLCHEWFVACSEAFYRDEDLRCVLVRSKDRVQAIAPLAIVKKGGKRYLELMGSSFLDEPSGLLYDSNESLEKLINAIIKLNFPFVLHKIPSDSPILNMFSNLSSFKGISIKRSTSSTAYIPIRMTWDDFYNSLLSKRRYDLRRARRRAEELGKVSFKIFCPSSDEIDTYLKIAFEIESMSWKGHEGSAILMKSQMKQFFENYLKLACKKGILRLGFFYINDVEVSMLIGLEYQNCFWVLKIGYDEKWRKCSPGIQLIHETIRYSFNQNLKSYEFLGSNESWLNMWVKNDLRRFSSLGFYSFNIQGIWDFSLDISKYVSHKVLNRKKNYAG